MKRIILYFPILFLIGCGSSPSIQKIKQSPITTQKLEAQKAWDELDGKITSNKSIIINKPSNINKQPNLTKNSIISTLQTSNSIPDWFYSPPQSDNYFYGAGEGKNLKQAQIAALDFIAREIQTTISSNLTISQGYTNNDGNLDFYKFVKNNINTQVKKIDFTNIETIKTIKVNNSIYTLVRINKQQLFNSLKTKLDILNSQINNEINNKNYSLLNQLITLNKLQPKIKKELSLAKLLNILNPNFTIEKYIKKYNDYINKKNKLLHTITFNISSNDLFKQKLIEVLNQNGYKVSNNSNIYIKLIKQIRKSNIMGLIVTKITINIEIIAKNKILHSTSLEVKGISNTYSQALANAANNFKQQLQEKGINKVLGFE